MNKKNKSEIDQLFIATDAAIKAQNWKIKTLERTIASQRLEIRNLNRAIVKRNALVKQLQKQHIQ